MTRDEAIALRTRQLQGAEVPAEQLAEAIQVIARTNTPLSRVPRALTYKGNKKRRRQQAPGSGVDIDSVHHRRAPGS